MNQKEIKKKQKRVMIYVMIISLICVVGVSYAFFTAGMSSETSTTVRADAGTMKITYDGGANINLAGIYPKDDVWATKTITVTGNNTTDAEMYYKLTLVVDSNTFKTDDPLQYELVSTNTSTNGDIIPNISKTDITGTSIELGSGHFVKANNAKHTYLLKIYYPKKATSQNANQGAAFSAHVEITSAKAPKTNGKLSELVLYNNEVKAPITTPGAAASTVDEALLASTVDDYGTSYYFRGAVKNNYVEFANKCWRIVRITGDGSIKLVLHNDNTSKATNPCSATNNSTTAAFAHYNGNTYTSKFNEKNDDNAYIGFMYGTASSSDYVSTHANTNKSTILTNLETWYKNNLVSYEDKLSDTIWCNDKSTLTTYTSGSTYGTGLGYGKNQTGYGAHNRLYGGNAALYANPSLICPNDNNGGKLSKFTVSDITNGNGNLIYKIGLLTADELTFAGYVSDSSITYLQENATGTYWWSLSPGYFSGISAGVKTVYGAGALLFTDGSVCSSNGVRPSISLKSTTNVTGEGTSDKPYKVI